MRQCFAYVHSCIHFEVYESLSGPASCALNWMHSHQFATNATCAILLGMFSCSIIFGLPPSLPPSPFLVAVFFVFPTWCIGDKVYPSQKLARYFSFLDGPRARYVCERVVCPNSYCVLAHSVVCVVFVGPNVMISSSVQHRRNFAGDVMCSVDFDCLCSSFSFSSLLFRKRTQ